MSLAGETKLANILQLKIPIANEIPTGITKPTGLFSKSCTISKIGVPNLTKYEALIKALAINENTKGKGTPIDCPIIICLLDFEYRDKSALLRKSVANRETAVFKADPNGKGLSVSAYIACKVVDENAVVGDVSMK
eukprot:Pgem_evm1s2237